MVGKFGIKIPSHNSLTPSFLSELMLMVATSRKHADAQKIKRRLQKEYHIAIISTGLSYLEYLGALKKSNRCYTLTRLGKRIGKSLASDRLEEANIAWRQLLEHHKLYKILKNFFASRYNQQGSLEEFVRYLKKRAHAKWKINVIRSRVSRLCELFADKGLIEYEHNHLALVDSEMKNSSLHSPTEGIADMEFEGLEISNSWPVKIEIKISISNKANPKFLETLLSFIKNVKVHDVVEIDAIR